MLKRPDDIDAECGERTCKVDLHVHSKHSTRPSEWILQKIGCAESYTEPLELYRIARARGMDLVTVTDHNTLAGSLDIAHLPGAFVSEEITTYFPEDRVKLHVLAWDVTEAQHEDITRVRQNVYDLVAYLREAGIAHGIAHPMYAMSEAMRPGHFERLMLLFENVELNGSRDDYQNGVVAAVATSLTRADIEYLADKHKLEPAYENAWRKRLTAGSDDHSSLNIARSWTAVQGAVDPASFLAGLREGREDGRGGERWSVGGRAATPRTMAYNLYSIAWQFYRDRFKLERFVGKDLLLRFTERALTLSRPRATGLTTGLAGAFSGLVCHVRAMGMRHRRPRTLLDAVHKGALEIITSEDVAGGDADLMQTFDAATLEPWQAEGQWFRFVDRASEKVLDHFAHSILTGLSGANIFDVFNAIGSAGSSYTLLAPYFVAYSLFTKDRDFCRSCHDAFRARRGQAEPRERMKVAHFTDTFFDVNGVARTLRQQAAAARRHGKALTVFTCGPEDTQQEEGVRRFDPIGSWAMPEYPDLTLYYPPLLKMLDHVYEQGHTLVHAATPGPMGLAALAVARILKLPFVGTYHTAFPQYASRLTGDPAMEELMWRYMVWFHNQMDVVYVPSKSFAEELADRGVREDKLLLYPRGIDTGRFHPDKRNGFYAGRYQVPETETTVLYVGRVSREKGLHHLAEAFRRAAAHRPDPRPDLRLIVVGDGPYLAEMRAETAGLPVVFTGALDGDDLARAYASADIFAFPSATDTFGNVVLEAQASGLPVIVTDSGGPAENVEPGVTGLVVPARDPRCPGPGRAGPGRGPRSPPGHGPGRTRGHGDALLRRRLPAPVGHVPPRRAQTRPDLGPDLGPDRRSGPPGVGRGVAHSSPVRCHGATRTRHRGPRINHPTEVNHMPGTQVLDPFTLNIPTAGHLKGALMRTLVQPSLTKLLCLDTLNALYRDMDPARREHDFVAYALDLLGVSLRVEGTGLEAIPATGPLVVVANHPFGAVEGLLLTHLLRLVRPDVRIMANHMLQLIPEMREHLIAVDPFGSADSTARNVSGLKQCLRFVRGGGCLGIFPAGEVASLNLRRMAVMDPPWSPTVGRIIRMTKAPVLPVFFHGANGPLFHLLGLAHPRMRTVLLPRQLLNKQDTEFTATIGKPLPQQKIMRQDTDSQLVEYLYLKTRLLGQGAMRPKRLPWPGKAARAAQAALPARDMEPVAEAVPVEAIEAEMASLPDEAVLVRNAEYLVFEAVGARIPQTLRQIGRLREINFREVGEGTGRPLDLDRFDSHYRHLVLWHTAGREIAGAYRMGETDTILRDLGPQGLYTATLFKFRASFLESIDPALELGRAFVASGHRKGYAPLLLLWKGIAAFVAREGRYRTLFGPVSISNDYRPFSRQLMMHFLKRHATPEGARMVKARRPPRLCKRCPGGLSFRDVATLLADPDDLSEAVSGIEADGKGMPVLLRQYLKLGGQVLTFNLDQDFGSAIDGLMLVDLTRTPKRVLGRYMGQDKAEAFLARHGVLDDAETQADASGPMRKSA